MQQKQEYNKMSSAEKLVAKYLDELGIKRRFEYPVFLKDERNRPRLWTPDFYLPDLNIYVEVCGSKDFSYEYRKRRYYENKIDVIYLHLYRDKEDWQSHFRKQLMVFIKERLTRLNKMMDLVIEK